MCTGNDRTAGYAIEHHDGAVRTPITVGTALLAPIASHLKAQGAAGELVVVRRGTGEPVIRWPLGPARGGPTP